MARDLREQEKEFVTGLALSTGRDLDGWMSAIAESGHGGRNDIIDWLRQQGFAFSNASWLERIHHNGGRLIYGDEDDSPTLAPRPQPSLTDASPAAVQPSAPSTPAAPATIPLAATPAQTESPVVAIVADPQELTALLMAAKGLRPLAELVLREIETLVPGTARLAAAPFIQVSAPTAFAALLPAPKELRLYADFGPQARDRARKAEAGRLPAPFPDVMILNDARLIDERFRELVSFAYTRALT